MNYAVIGQGFIWPRHKEAIEKTGGKVVATCDINPDKGADYARAEDFYASEEFASADTAVILLPNYLHSEHCRTALEKGKKVICEKPLTIFNDYDGLEYVNVVMQLRYNPVVQELQGQDGNIDIFVKTYREPKYFESWKGEKALSGGILHNMGVHYIDLLTHVLGEPVEIRRSAVGDLRAEGEVLFEGGKGTYHIELTTTPMPVIRRLTVNGDPINIEGATIPLNDSGQVVNLHTRVYEEYLKGNGLKLAEARRSLDLIKQLHDVAHIL